MTKTTVRVWTCAAALVGALGGAVSASFAQVMPIELDAMNMTASPVSGDFFPAVDVNGVLGMPGASILFGAATIGLWTGSSDPQANRGFIDPTAQAFSLNWGGRTTFNVFNSSGMEQIGTGEILAVLPETGTFDPVTGDFTSGNPTPAVGQLFLRDLNSTVVLFGDININNNNRGNINVTTGNGVVLASVDPEMTMLLPSSLGMATLEARLAGTFHVIPSPGALSLLAMFGVLAAKRRR